MRRFSQTGIQDFLTLTLREHSGLLYVGAREALFAFSVEALELQGVVRGGAAGGTQDWGVCGLGRLSHSPEVSLGIRISTCSPLLGSSRWDRFGACVRMGTRWPHSVAQAVFVAHTLHMCL